MLKNLLLPALLNTLPLLAAAQNTAQDSLLRTGDLVGGRPRVVAPKVAARRPTVTTADPYLARLLHENIDLSGVEAGRLPELYSNFLEAVRAERRTWTAADWDEASDALARINARYEVVRQELPFSDRLDIRTLQGEFRTLQGARRVKDGLR